MTGFCNKQNSEIEPAPARLIIKSAALYAAAISLINRLHGALVTHRLGLLRRVLRRYIFSGLPDKLRAGCFNLVQTFHHAVVDGACSQASSYNQDCFLGWVQPERADSIFTADVMVAQSLADGVAGQDNLVFSKKRSMPSYATHILRAFFANSLLVTPA